jgi:hypothetical protein
MYIISKENNSIKRIDSKTFKELGYKERENLQEWIEQNSDVFGEEMLFIQKEFDGFNDTNERLDLLALDKQGNLVVIENKLDDSGKDVIWQVLKYASYCSSLTKQNIKEIYQDYLDKSGAKENAEDLLKEFYDDEDFEELQLNVGNTQRIIMVAANFRKEITSTVLWLMNYKLRIQCFKVTPFQLEDEHFLNFEQIIPVKDIEEYMISMAEKSQSDINTQEQAKTRYNIRMAYWKKLIPEMNKRIDLYKNVNPSKDNWISGGSGMASVGFNTSVSKSYARVEVYLSKFEKVENKFIFDQLYKQKEEIEKAFEGDLVWERLDNKKASRIKCQLDGVSYFNEEDWDKMIKFQVESMTKMTKTFKEPLKVVKSKL